MDMGLKIGRQALGSQLSGRLPAAAETATICCVGAVAGRWLGLGDAGAAGVCSRFAWLLAKWGGECTLCAPFRSSAGQDKKVSRLAMLCAECDVHLADSGRQEYGADDAFHACFINAS